MAFSLSLWGSWFWHAHYSNSSVIGTGRAINWKQKRVYHKATIYFVIYLFTYLLSCVLVKLKRNLKTTMQYSVFKNLKHCDKNQPPPKGNLKLNCLVETCYSKHIKLHNTALSVTSIISQTTNSITNSSANPYSFQ